MGRAVITGVEGAGLFQARPIIDSTRAQLELDVLLAERDQFPAALLAAVNSADTLGTDTNTALQTLLNIITQYQQKLISQYQPLPPLPPQTPQDPITGEDWVDPDRAQEWPLLDKINDFRAAQNPPLPPLERHVALDRSVLQHLIDNANLRRIGQIDPSGADAEDRARQAGFNPNEIVQGDSYGAGGVDQAFSEMLREREFRDALLNPDITHIGLAYKSGSHWAGNAFCVVLANENPNPPAYGAVKADPARAAAKNAVHALRDAQMPNVERFDLPYQLIEATKALQLAGLKWLAAKQSVGKLQAENTARESRIAELQAATSEMDPMDIWCVAYDFRETLKAGIEVDTFEVPGFWCEDGVRKTATLWRGTEYEKEVSYIERSWNIAAFGQYSEATGKLAPNNNLTDAGMFVNAALEPGHLKWRPMWRYGTLTSVNTDANTGSVSLENVEARALPDDEVPLLLNEQPVLTNIPIRYLDCDSDAFSPGDEVVVAFTGEDRKTATIIGFRREPKPCGSGAESWMEIRIPNDTAVLWVKEGWDGNNY